MVLKKFSIFPDFSPFLALFFTVHPLDAFSGPRGYEIRVSHQKLSLEKSVSKKSLGGYLRSIGTKKKQTNKHSFAEFILYIRNIPHTLIYKSYKIFYGYRYRKASKNVKNMKNRTF